MTKTRLEPTGKRILIERIPEATESEGGIIIPEQSIAKPNQGFIVDVGAEVLTKSDIEGPGKQTFDIGDKVMIGQYAGVEMGIDGRNFVLVMSDEIICKIIEVEVTN